MIKRSINENGQILYLDNDGFLDVSDYQSEIAKQFLQEFAVAREINQYIYELYDSINVHKQDVINRFIISSLNKVHKSFQAAVLCCSKGLEEQAKILIRTMLDKIMIATAVMKNPKNYNKWIKMQLWERNGLIKDIRDNVPGLDHLDLDDGIQIDNRGKFVSQKKWAEMAEMTADYNFIYRLFSGEVHLSARSVDWDYEFGGDESYMNIAPRAEKTNKIILTLADYMMCFIKTVINHFNRYTVINHFNRYLEIDKKLEYCQKKYLDKSRYAGKK